MENNNISMEEMQKSDEIIKAITNYYTSRIVGQKNLQNSLLISLIANGHILVESVPGLAKTTAASIQNQINELESFLVSTPHFSLDSVEIDKLNKFVEFLDNLKGDVDSTIKVISKY